MKTEIHFLDIKGQIIKHLRAAETEVKLAVAWLTDGDLIREITKKKKQGLHVTVVISNDIANFRNVEKFKLFVFANGLLFIAEDKFLHHKFCLIDSRVFINGSYNWTYYAQRNEENITITTLQNDSIEATKFFQRIKLKYEFLCSKLSKLVVDVKELNSYGFSSLNYNAKIVVTDEAEIKLRGEFEDHVKRSINASRELCISNLRTYSNLFARMESEGGGVYFVKRMLRDEMNKLEIKSGFTQLVRVIPRRVDLSLEYLVAQSKYASLFSSNEIKFCVDLMHKYNLNI